MELPSFERARVYVIGDLILDQFDYVRRTRVSAEDLRAWCVDVVKRVLSLGGAGNTARCIKTLGGHVTILAVTGAGYHADKLKKALDDARVQSALVRTEGRPTTHKVRYVDADTGEQYLVPERQTRDPIPTWIEDGLLGRLKELEVPDVVVVSDYDRGEVTKRLGRGVADYCAEHGIPLIVDGRPRPLDWYEKTFGGALTLITPNLRELAGMVSRELKTQDDLDIAAREAAEVLKCAVLVTRAHEGAKLFYWHQQQGWVEQHFDACNGKDQAVSVSGAGDSVVATIAVSLAVGVSLHDACVMAQHTAAICVKKPGTAVATYDELLEHVANCDRNRMEG